MIRSKIKWKFEFSWFGWNESDGEVGRSYGGHEENYVQDEKICSMSWSEEKLKC